MPTKLFLIGAGGHAKVVLDAAQGSGLRDIQVWDDDESLCDGSLLGCSIKAPVDLSHEHGVGHVAIGDIKARYYWSLKLEDLGFAMETIVHNTAAVSKFCDMETGCFIAAHSVVAPDSSLGKSVIVNHGAIIDHDCKVGHFSHIAPNATLGGGVTIGKNCLVGAGAVILPGVKIADDVIVGAGAVVVSDIIEKSVTVIGVPAK